MMRSRSSTARRTNGACRTRITCRSSSAAARRRVWRRSGGAARISYEEEILMSADAHASATAADRLALEQLAVNTIRFLAADAVENAKSGHPGMPMGMADAAFVLWTRF